MTGGKICDGFGFAREKPHSSSSQVISQGEELQLEVQEAPFRSPPAAPIIVDSKAEGVLQALPLQEPPQPCPQGGIV
ncbi:hypothetical protein FQA47_015870 [Oryzias melastigma]|uniref:Uncharacterized protein n=1 Tax=Oryzias melastigma TaxID=30732 RepID=A0A834C7S0_ORYME|nr:hypothetical protein FQA47_015870 [Oryzias melastigma]